MYWDRTCPLREATTDDLKPSEQIGLTSGEQLGLTPGEQLGLRPLGEPPRPRNWRAARTDTWGAAGPTSEEQLDLKPSVSRY